MVIINSRRTHGPFGQVIGAYRGNPSECKVRDPKSRQGVEKCRGEFRGLRDRVGR